MKQEILTAKEWLDTNLIKDCVLSNKEIEGMDLDGYITCSEVMELYAKSKNRILEDRIKEFSKKLGNEALSTFLNNKDLGDVIKSESILKVQKEYDKHFNIK